MGVAVAQLSGVEMREGVVGAAVGCVVVVAAAAADEDRLLAACFSLSLLA